MKFLTLTFVTTSVEVPRRTPQLHTYELISMRCMWKTMLQETLTKLNQKLDAHTYSVLSGKAVEYNRRLHSCEYLLWDSSLYVHRQDPVDVVANKKSD